jgi:tetratricopeptide (TPR) repeat protein
MQNLGLIALHVGRNDDAIDLICRAIALRPGYAEAHSNLGNALRHKGQLDEAIVAYRQAIALNPSLASAHHSWGGSAQAPSGMIYIVVHAAIGGAKRVIRCRPSKNAPRNINWFLETEQ